MNLWAFPMHGEIKMRKEGLRTRDGHLIEWLSRLGHRISIASRPEPWPRATIARMTSAPILLAGESDFKSPEKIALPNLRDGRRWWASSADSLAVWSLAPEGAVVWNPFALPAIKKRRIAPAGRIVFDLLDDWTIHHQFRGISRQVNEAYSASFEMADAVTANSEGTVALAQRFGRPDVELILNGVDPDKFSLGRSPRPKRNIIGYAGKISQRVDVELISETARAMPDYQFIVAGPSYDRTSSEKLEGHPNIRLLGDIHYSNYPKLLASFDVGWIPHRVGEGGEIGGDVIKLYEYRAAGLPTFMTPFAGRGRGLSGVRIHERAEMIPALIKYFADHPGAPREPAIIPTEMTWEHKAHSIDRLLRPTAPKEGSCRDDS